MSGMSGVLWIDRSCLPISGRLWSPPVVGGVRFANLFSFLCCVFGGIRVAHLFSFLCCVFGGVRVAHLFSFLCCVFGGVRVARLFVFLCCAFCFACLRSMSCVPNYADFSGLCIVDCLFGFL
jgi:hypothetical protein